MCCSVDCSCPLLLCGVYMTIRRRRHVVFAHDDDDDVSRIAQQWPNGEHHEWYTLNQAELSPPLRCVDVDDIIFVVTFF